jgi:dihydrofolate reductase
MNHPEQMVSMISAMTHDRVIGAMGGGIPWHLPRDVSHFRKYTDNKHMLLGRKTFDEMSGWFSTQTPLVLTSQQDYRPGIGARVGSVAEAIEFVQTSGAGELVVSGGAQVYASALPFADRLVLTIVDATVEGVAYFPDFRATATWETVSEGHFAADQDNRFAMTFITLDRVRDAGNT